MLKDKDRIFQNLYNDMGSDVNSSKKRGDWVDTKNIIAKYPEGKQQSAVMALLYIAQRQNNNWIPLAAMKYIAKFLDMPYIKVYEVATFYTMYNLSPVGKFFVQVCTTTPCMIRGANKLVEACKEKISVHESELSSDKNCSWMEVECLGALSLIHI